MTKYLFTEKVERDERKATVKTEREKRKRKNSFVDLKSGSFSVNTENVSNISDDDVENYRAHNEQLWKYFLDDNNFKCAKTDK